MESGAKAQFNYKKWFKKTSILWALLLLVLVMSLMSPTFLKPRNLVNVMKQIAINGILAIGMTVVLLTGGIDLSVGAVVAISSIIAAYFGRTEPSFPMVAPMALSIAAGVAVGLANGFFVASMRVPPFIVTLAIQTIIRGVALLVTDGVPIFGLSKPMINLANGSLFGLPNLVFFLFGLLIVVFFFLNATVFGKHVYAVGGNELSAVYSGINAKKIKISAYAISGFCAGLAGLLVASRITSGSPVSGTGYETNAIAAAVIGGVSMSGGKGFLPGTIIGALIIGVVQNGLDILGVSSYYQNVIQGVIILAAVLIDIRNNNND